MVTRTHPMMTLLLAILLVYGVLLAAMYSFQRQLLYHPTHSTGTPHERGLAGFEERFQTTADGVSVQLWHHPAQRGLPTLVYFHGNGGNLGDRAAVYNDFANYGFGVLALSYRGYGKSGGSLSEDGLYHDARAAIDFLIKQQQIPPARIILYGESLGTGVAVRMASEYVVGLLVLQAPYTSVAGRAQELYPFIPVRLLLKDPFDSLSIIPSVRAPLMLFHGEHDNVIPVTHGRAIYEKANSPKRAFFLPGVGHNDFDSRMISAHVYDYVNEFMPSL